MNILEEIKNLLIDKKNSYFLLTTRNNHLGKIYNVFDDLIDYNEKCVFLIGQENTYLLTTNKNIIHDNNNEKDYRVILTKDEDDIIENIKAKLNDNELIIDSRTISTSLAFKLGNNINNIKEDQTITPFVFKQDKKLSLVYKLDEFFVGLPYSEKIKNIKNLLEINNCKSYIISSLTNQEYLYNLRSHENNIDQTFLSYTIVEKDKTILFVDPNKINKIVNKYLTKNNIIIKPYNEFYSYLKEYDSEVIALDYNLNNYHIYNVLKNKNTILNIKDPTVINRTIKTKPEIDNTKIAYIKESVAIIKLIHILKDNKDKLEFDKEIVTTYLKDYEEQNDGFVSNIKRDVTYESINEKNTKSNSRNGLICISSSSNYLEGTTSISRTISIGKITDEIKTKYTLLLKSNLAFENLIIPKGLKGYQIDAIIRAPFWAEHINYDSKTGEGLGYLYDGSDEYNVIDYRKEYNDNEIKENMITLFDPILNKNESYLSLTDAFYSSVDKDENFINFTRLGLIPFDPNLIKTAMLTRFEKASIIAYNEKIINELSNHLDKETLDWLKKYSEI